MRAIAAVNDDAARHRLARRLAEQDAGAEQAAFWTARYAAALRYSDPGVFERFGPDQRRERFARLARAGMNV